LEEPHDDPLEEDEEGIYVEVVDALPVLSEARPHDLALERPAAPGGLVLAQTAAVAVGSFVAGAATAAVLGRHLGRRIGARARNGLAPRMQPPSPASGVEALEVVATRAFLVNVHVLGRREP
jgi:hypothetical protein